LNPGDLWRFAACSKTARHLVTHDTDLLMAHVMQEPEGQKNAEMVQQRGGVRNGFNSYSPTATGTLLL
jgi:hypothetical protein